MVVRIGLTIIVFNKLFALWVIERPRLEPKMLILIRMSVQFVAYRRTLLAQNRRDDTLKVRRFRYIE